MAAPGTSDNPLLAAALDYAARGWRVFPCKPGGKEPLAACVPHGCKDATTDPATIRRWWQREPAANVAIATGRGLLVVDVDVKHGQDGRPYIAAHPELFPPTLTVHTPSGGEHYYYTYPAERTIPNRRLAPGVDSRGDGGYVLAPPSRLDPGAYYATGPYYEH